MDTCCKTLEGSKARTGSRSLNIDCDFLEPIRARQIPLAQGHSTALRSAASHFPSFLDQVCQARKDIPHRCNPFLPVPNHCLQSAQIAFSHLPRSGTEKWANIRAPARLAGEVPRTPVFLFLLSSFGICVRNLRSEKAIVISFDKVSWVTFSILVK